MVNVSYYVYVNEDSSSICDEGTSSTASSGSPDPVLTLDHG